MTPVRAPGLVPAPVLTSVRARALVLALAPALVLGGCQGCSKKADSGAEPATSAPASASASSPSSAVVVKESLPRCRADGARLPIPGDDVVTGDAAVTSDALLVGIVRREGTKRIASVVRASLDLATSKVLDLGAALGDHPPPSPRVHAGKAYVASFARTKAGGDAGASASAVSATGDAGAQGAAAGTTSMTRVLEIARLDGAALVSEGSVLQQADESLAYDVAWPDAEQGAPLVVWDEDAPPRAGALLADRGVVKAQLLGAGTKPRVVSPETTDAEAPRLVARRGGYWLAWLARRTEAGEDAGASGAAEGPGERRAYRWVELVALDAKGEVASPVRRVSPEKGHVASFELATSGEGTQLVVVVQDETAAAEGAGERIVRYAIEGERTESADLLDGGVGHALAELLPPGADAAAPRWLAFTDPQEHARLVPLGPALRLAGAATTEPSLDGARIVAAAPPDLVYAAGAAASSTGAGTGSQGGPPGSRVELRRFVCR